MPNFVMPNKVLLITALLVLLATSCARQSQSVGVGVAAGACAAPALGIIADDNLQVLGIIPNSAAEFAGVQVGDVLVDLTWIKLEPQPACNDVIEMDASGSPLPMPTRMIVEVEQPPHPTEPVPFTDRTTISEMTHYGATMRLRLLRAGEEVELTITPIVPRVQANEPSGMNGSTPTPTPMPTSHDYF